MRECEILSNLILRAPYYPQDFFDRHTTDELMDDPLFISAIAVASKSLYFELANKKFRAAQCSPKTINALKKYANRMTHRSTPFGAFSSFSFLKWQNGIENISIPDDSYLLHKTVDFSSLLHLSQRIKIKSPAELKLYANYSIYCTSDGIRYLHFENSENFRRNFSIRKVESNAFVIAILNYCSRERAADAAAAFITQRFGFKKKEAVELIMTLCEMQLLVSNLAPNITGEDFYSRIKSGLDVAGQTNIRNIDQYIVSETIDKTGFIKLPKTVFYEKQLEDLNIQYYVNLERNVSEGCPDYVRESLKNGLSALKKLSNNSDQGSLSDFKRAFRQKFEHRVIPLMYALDPEIGISYDNLAHSSQTEDFLINEINFSNKEPEKNFIDWSPLHQLLLNKWPKDGIGTVVLLDDDIAGLPKVQSKLPPSFSVLFKVINRQIYIEEAGGCSSTALMGRFTPFNNSIHEHSRNIAVDEARINKKIIFAEIAFLCEGHVDNINRRKQIRDYEIPICTHSTLSPNRQIKLSDLFISMENDELLLWSSKLNRRIVPRLSSAFNYRRNDLSVFRFLCDLQYQDIQHSFGLDLMRLFPGLSAYPRVIHNNCIFSLSTWVLSGSKLKGIFEQPLTERNSRFLDIANSIQLPRKVALVRGDQYLVFDLDNNDGIRLLLEEINSLEKVVFKEVLLEEDMAGTVINDRGQTFSNQFVASVLNHQEVYPELFNKPRLKARYGIKSKFFTGSEWLYYKIYCRSFNSNEILIELYQTFSKLSRQGLLKQWFFVRYKDPNFHLRVRLNAAPAQLLEIIPIMNKILERLQTKHKVEQLMTDTYVRETGRYSANNMVKIEHIFCASSELIARSLLNHISAPGMNASYAIAVTSAYDIVKIFAPDSGTRLEFFDAVKESLFHEFGGSNDLKIGLGIKRRKLKSETAELLNDKNFYKKNRLEKCADQLFRKLKLLPLDNEKVSKKLLADLIHMHINRAFSDNMREHELVVYTLLHQFELTLSKTKKEVKESFDGTLN